MHVKKLVLVAGLAALLVMGLAAVAPLTAQTATPTALPTPAPGTTVMVIGPVAFVDTQITVNGYVIVPVGISVPTPLLEGTYVIVVGVLQPDGITIQASEFEFFDDSLITPTPTATATMTPTVTPSTTPGPIVVTVTPSATVNPFTPTPIPPTFTPVPTQTAESCARPDHPVARQLAETFGVSYEEIINWHCQGFGFGEIARAYLLAEETGRAAAEFFALKAGGMGWGQIMHDAGIQGSEHSQLSPGQAMHRDRDGDGDIDDDDQPGNGNGNGHGNGNGNGNNGNGNGNGRGNGNG